MKQTLEEAAMQDLNSSDAIIVEGNNCIPATSDA